MANCWLKGCCPYRKAVGDWKFRNNCQLSANLGRLCPQMGSEATRCKFRNHEAGVRRAEKRD